MITSSQGLIHIIDIARPASGGEFSQVSAQLFVTGSSESILPPQVDSHSFISAAAVSPNGTYLAFGDAEGSVSTPTSTSTDEHIPFNGFDGRPVEWADVPDPLPDLTWDDRTYATSPGQLIVKLELFLAVR